MDAGQLKYRVTIQQLTGAQDSSGAEADVWRDVAPSWAAIRPLQGREQVNAQQIVADVTHKVTMRYRPGLTPKMRLLFGTRKFNILSVLNIDEANVELVLMCQELV